MRVTQRWLFPNCRHQGAVPAGRFNPHAQRELLRRLLHPHDGRRVRAISSPQSQNSLILLGIAPAAQTMSSSIGSVRFLSSTFHADTCNVDESTPFHFRQLKVRRGLCKSSSRPRNKDVAYTWWGQCCQSVYGSVRERGKARERGHGIPNDWEHVCSNIYPTPLLIIYTISFYNIQRRYHCLLVF